MFSAILVQSGHRAGFGQLAILTISCSTLELDTGSRFRHGLLSGRFIELPLSTLVPVWQFVPYPLSR